MLPFPLLDPRRRQQEVGIRSDVVLHVDDARGTDEPLSRNGVAGVVGQILAA